MKTVRTILSPEAEEAYKRLLELATSEKVAQSILNGFNRKRELIKLNHHYGEPIAKDRIPVEYREKYGATNLFWVELPDYWRMLYSLSEGETDNQIVALILGVLNHKEYNKKFGYKGK